MLVLPLAATWPLVRLARGDAPVLLCASHRLLSLIVSSRFLMNGLGQAVVRS
jgi:hypothetical protein